MSDSAAESIAGAILRQAPDAIIYADASGTIREWNDAAERMFGFPSEEAVGQNLDIIIPERLRPAHWKGFEAAVASGRTRTGGQAMLTRATRKSGEKLYVEMSFSLVTGENGVVAGAIAIARDVTVSHLAKAAKAAAQ